MSDTLPTSRPKIEVVRLPSHERAKLRPLLEGGVQLRAQFQHLRYGDYASYSSLDNGNKQCFRFCDHEYMGHKPPLATKSLDNIFARQLTYGTEQGSPFLWQDATRSEEQLYHAPHTFSGTPCSANKASRFSGARSHISALLKKLSLWPHHKAAPPNSPWVVVESSSQDPKCPDATGWVNSVTSDQSFNMDLQATRLRKEQAAINKNFQEQVSYVGSDRPCKKGEDKQHRSLGTGLAARKHRAAFNTG